MRMEFRTGGRIVNDDVCPCEHGIDEFPAECVRKLVEFISSGNWREAVPCALDVIKWMWGQIFRPPLGDDQTQAANFQAYSGVLDVNKALGGTGGEFAAQAGPITTAVLIMLIKQTLPLLIKLIQDGLNDDE